MYGIFYAGYYNLVLKTKQTAHIALANKKMLMWWSNLLWYQQINATNYHSGNVTKTQEALKKCLLCLYNENENASNSYFIGNTYLYNIIVGANRAKEALNNMPLPSPIPSFLTLCPKLWATAKYILV